jgi:hypothetical protein
VKSEEFQRLEKQRLRSPKRHYYDHLKRVENDKKALVILLTDRDVDIFVRQAINGKASEGHIRELYDRVVRDLLGLRMDQWRLKGQAWRE